MHIVDPQCDEADLLKYTRQTPTDWKKALQARRDYTAGRLSTLHVCITYVQCSNSNIHLHGTGVMLSHPPHLYIIHNNLRIV